MSTVVVLVERALSATEPLVMSVTGQDLRRPTPCPGMDLGTLTAHLVGGLRGVAEVGEGGSLRYDADPDLDGEDAATAFRSAGRRLVGAFDRPGALDRTFTVPWGPTTGRQLVGFMLIEVLVHGWDIGRSLALPVRYDDDLVVAAFNGATLWVDESVRNPRMFGPEVAVAPTAPPVDRLVGFLGRRPDWTPEDRERGE